MAAGCGAGGGTDRAVARMTASATSSRLTSATRCDGVGALLCSPSRSIRNGYGLASTIPVGVDAGRDLATSGLGRSVKEEIFKKTEADVRSNVHGLDVFARTTRTRAFSV